MKRLLTGVLVAALLLSQTSIADVFVKTDAATVTAAEQETEPVIETEETVEVYNAEGRTISAFIELPDDIKVQSVPVGTALDELKLPDTLEAVCVVTVADVDADAGTDTNADVDAGADIDDGAGTDTDADADVVVDEDTDTGISDDIDVNTDVDVDTDTGVGADTDIDTDAGADKDADIDTDAGADKDADVDADTDTNAGADEDVYVDVSNEADLNADTYIDTDVAPDDDTLGGGTVDAESDTEKVETFSVTMPEYQTEHVIEVKTLEAGTITIENVTWQSKPEYDGDTEGEYIFTAVLPDGYVLTDGVNTPQITVTVGGTDNIALLLGDGIMLMASDLTITDEAGLREFSYSVNQGESYAGFTVTLGNDITLTDEWTPIGSEEHPFKGVFDGGGHTINELSIRSNTSSSRYVGLFGYVFGGTIQNLTVNGTVELTVNASAYVGGIVGYNKEGTITNCRNESAIHIEGAVNTGYYVGGIVGQDFAGTVTKCRNEGDVTGDSRAGGIVGGNNTKDTTTIENCRNEGDVTGDYAGGIMGSVCNGWGRPVESIQAKIENCWNEGKVTGDSRAGGIMVYNSAAENAIIKNCGNKGKVTSDDARYVGEILGPFGNETTITNCYYLNDTENTGIAGKDDEEGQVEAKTSTEFASGEVAWLLQNPQKVDSSYDAQGGLVWGQHIGDDKSPRLAYFMDGDEDEKWVYKVTFHNAGSSTASYTEYAVKYANKNTLQLPDEPQRPASFPSDEYKAVWLDSTDNTAKIFGVDTPVEKDTDLYLFYKYKEAFAGEDGTITAQHGTSKTEDLDGYIKYADNTSTAGNFTYEITAGNGELGASLNGSTLTIPGTADAGSYELTIEASEKTSQMKNLKDEVNVTVDVTDSNIDSVTFTLTVIVEKSDSDLIDEAKDVVQKALDDMNVTNATTKKDVQDAIKKALEEAGLEGVTATVGDDFTVEEATEDSEGKITGKVTLEKGEEKDEVEIDKKIDQLEQPGMPSEPTPQASVDRPNGKITDLIPGAKYDITYTDASGTPHTDTVTVDESGSLDIEDAWTDGTVDIVKKGNGMDVSDSQPQKLDIPEREPGISGSLTVTNESVKGANDGKVGGLVPGEEYEVSTDGGKTWKKKTANNKGEISPLAPGSYDVRRPAGENTLPSKSVQVSIQASSIAGGSGSTGGDSGNTGSGGSTGGNNGGSSSGSGNGSQSSGNNSGGTGTGSNTSSGTQTGTDTTDDTQADTQTGTGTRNGRGNSTGTKRAGASSSSNTGTTDNKDSDQSASTDTTTNSAAEASTDTNQHAGQSEASGTDGQTTGSAAQTVKAGLKDGKITVEGDVVVTGTVRTAETTMMTLAVGEGAVIVTVVSDEFRSEAGVADTVAVANAVLTPEQIQRVNDGETIEIRVDVKDISGQVSQEDKDIIESGLSTDKAAGAAGGEETEKLTLGAYIDISMYIKIGDGNWDAITRSDEPIEVVIGVPEELQDGGRTYYIARAHEGEYTLLEDLDDEADTITIRTGMFSTYAIVFKQVPGAGADASSGFLASLSWTAVALWSLGILVMIALAVILILGKRRKEEQV